MRLKKARPKSLLARSPLARSSGFTLIEVILAISISTFVIMAARMLLENLAAGTDRVVRSTHEIDRDANGERLLRSLVGQIEVGIQKETFGGDERSAEFTSWCRVARGWMERCRVTLSIDSVNSAPSLVTTLPDGAHVVLRRAKYALRLRYLVDAREGGTWFVKWGDGLLAPRAIGVLADSDTVIVRIGERG
jgi:prepilin-type N-terminal cleavage/methylation domain-containing protein